MKTPEKYNKEDCSFDDWWDYAVMIYSKGWLQAPIIGFDEEAYERGEYPYYIPSLEEVESFRGNLGLKAQYESLYNDGDNIEMAFVAMY
jgi:hypothetical protein